jgi:lipopolysaccharide/colanic/teichoic acid biosynthesis glycosyltransferase
LTNHFGVYFLRSTLERKYKGIRGEGAILRRARSNLEPGSTTWPEGQADTPSNGQVQDAAESLPFRGHRSRSVDLERALDIVVSLMLLTILVPLLLLIAVLIKVESPGPVLYRSRRVGRDNRHFDVLKFRKMHRDATGSPLTSSRDLRFTRLGGFLARTKLDELPQLLNVLRGEMSLVGPRPEDPAFVALFPEEFNKVLQVRPGVTGLSQLAFAQENRVLDVPDPMRTYSESVLPAKLSIDRLYVDHASLRINLRILGWTLPAVLGVGVAVDRQDARLTVRRRPSVAVPDPTPRSAVGLEVRH